MKIQTYRSKVAMTDKVAGQPLNVQASSAAFEAVGQSVVKVGDAVAAQSDWMVVEAKLLNASEEAKGKRAIQEDLANIATKLESDPIVNSDPEAMSVAFRTRAARAITKVSKTVKGNKAKSTFISDASDLATKTRLTAKNNARARLTSKVIAQKLERADELKKLIADDPNNQKLRDELFGRGNVRGIYDQLSDLGHINEKQRYTYEQSDKNKISVNMVERLLLGANQLSLTKADIDSGAAAKAARSVAMQLQQNQFPDLSVQARMDLQENANNLIDQLERSRISEINRRDSAARKNKTKKQDNNAVALLSRIMDAQLNPTDKKLQQNKPTLAEVAKAFKLQKITAKDRDAIVASLQDQGPAITDDVWFHERLKNIRNAQNKAQIEEQVKLAYKNVGLGKKIDFNQLTRITQYAEQFVTKTPRARAAKGLGDLLDALTKPTGILDKFLPGASQKAALIVAQFDAGIQETDRPPIELFREALAQFDSDNDVNLRAVPYPRFPPEIQTGPGIFEHVKKPLSQWTVDEVAQARANTLGKWKGKPTMLGLELFNLRMLERYLDESDPAKLQARAELQKGLDALKKANKQ